VPLRPSPGPAAAEPDARPDAGQADAPGGEPDARLDARYEQLRHAALHARARAFPLGFGVLIGKGVTAWRRLVSRLAHPPDRDTSPATSAPADITAGDGGRSCGRCELPTALTAELINALAAVALGGTTRAPAPP
jgi:hypothetical protein